MEPPAKRTKLRKGTFSCSECKRRKKRCRLETPSATKCVLCVQNGDECTPQDGEEALPAGIESRIRHVEGLVEDFIHTRAASHGTRLLEQSTRPQNHHQVVGPSTIATITPKSNMRTLCLSLSAYLQSILPLPATVVTIFECGKSPYGWMWPISSDSKNCIEYEMSSAATAVAFPMSYACKLLQLALCLIQPGFRQSKPAHLQLWGQPQDVARRFAVAAQRATAQDVLARSLDGIESLQLESLYLIHVGQTSTACAIARRALQIAQSMSLHKLPPTADERVRYVWFRLVYTNQWMTLALGDGPLLSTDDVSSMIPSPTDGPARTLDKLHIIIGTHIISRNSKLQRHHPRDEDDPNSAQDGTSVETDTIDQKLKQAIRSVPVEFWAIPDQPVQPEAETMDTTSRIMIHIHQNYLTILCHQPRIIEALHQRALCVGDQSQDCSFLYAKYTTISSSRELLLRFPEFLRYPHLAISMKGLMHKAAVAIQSVLLLHLNGHYDGSMNGLEHQRPYDLNLISQAVSRIETLETQQGISTNEKTTNLLRALIEAESHASEGAVYTIWSSWYAGRPCDDALRRKGISLYYPYFGEVVVFKADTTNDSGGLANVGLLMPNG
jgi:hypothetical protein